MVTFIIPLHGRMGLQIITCCRHATYQSHPQTSLKSPDGANRKIVTLFQVQVKYPALKRQLCVMMSQRDYCLLLRKTHSEDQTSGGLHAYSSSHGGTWCHMQKDLTVLMWTPQAVRDDPATLHLLLELCGVWRRAMPSVCWFWTSCPLLCLDASCPHPSDTIHILFSHWVVRPQKNANA